MKLHEAVTSAAVGNVPPIGYTHENDEFILRPAQLHNWMFKKKKKLNEDLAYIKFRYSNAKHDKRPQVQVLDMDYPGIKGQKTYGQRSDVLGWNINYVDNKQEAKKAIDDITTFAKMLSANRHEMYKRIKYFYPEQSKFIRRYMKDHMHNIRQKNNVRRWKRANWNSMKQIDNELY